MTRQFCAVRGYTDAAQAGGTAWFESVLRPRGCKLQDRGSQNLLFPPPNAQPPCRLWHLESDDVVQQCARQHVSTSAWTGGGGSRPATTRKDPRRASSHYRIAAERTQEGGVTLYALRVTHCTVQTDASRESESLPANYCIGVAVALGVSTHIATSCGLHSRTTQAIPQLKRTSAIEAAGGERVQAPAQSCDLSNTYMN